MYYLDFKLADWHEGLIFTGSSEAVLAINQEHQTTQIRIYTDFNPREQETAYTLDFKTPYGKRWNRLLAASEDHLYYTMATDDLKASRLDIQLIGTKKDGTVIKTPIYRDLDILPSINATSEGTDSEASMFKEALIELASWTKGEKGDKGDTGEQGPKGDTGEKGAQGERGETGETGAIGPKGDTGATGPTGADGYSPVKGVDYWTTEDKAEIKNDILPVVEEEKTQRTNMDAAILENLATETSNREKADTALTTSFEALSDNIASRYEALANAKVVELKKYISSPLEANGVGDWIALTGARTSTTVAALDNRRLGGTIYYYDEFATALADFNSCVTTSGSATKSDTSVCSLYILSSTGGLAIYENIPILTLLADVEYNDANILVNHDGILNLNGHILKTSKAMQLGNFQANNSIMIYGKKVGSKFESSSNPGLVLHGRNNYLYYGDYSIKSSTAITKETGLIVIKNSNSNFGKNGVIDIVGVNMTLECGEQETALSAVVSGVYNRLSYWPSTLIMENVTMTMNGHNSQTTGVKCLTQYCGFNYFKNCTISVTSDDFGENNKNNVAAIGVSCNSRNSYIENCDIDATNYAVRLCNGVIRNSTLKGGVHGGLYNVLVDNLIYAPFFKTLETAVYRNFINLNGESNVYVQNCTIKRVDKKLKEAYNYSCYISGGNIWFDNCSFENEMDDEYKAPAIRSQTNYNSKILPLSYFSNCKMGSEIRVDSGITAYFGKGMDENITVGSGSGTIERTNETYASIPMVTTQYVESMEEESTTS